MRIVENWEKLPTIEARRTGRTRKKVYYLEHQQRRVGPYFRFAEAQCAHDRALEAARKALYGTRSS